MQKTDLKLDKIKFEPLGLFKSGHFQTIYNALFFKPPELKDTKDFKLKLDDKNTVVCHYNHNDKNNSNTCVILVHGLEGSSISNYVVSTASKLFNQGLSVIRINIRNCGGTSHLTETLYNAGLSDDVKKLVDYTVNHLGYKNVFTAGFSLGANTVLKMAGEYAEEFPEELKGVIAVSPPLDLLECSDEIIKPRNIIYDDHYRKRLVKTYKNKKRFYPDHIDLKLTKKIKNLKDFDNYITGPSFGYKDAEEYYRENSSLKFLPEIKVITLIIQSKDDPIIPFASTEKALKINNKNVHYLITEHGGHVGFTNSLSASKDDLDRHWAENRIVDFVNKMLN